MTSIISVVEFWAYLWPKLVGIFGWNNGSTVPAKLFTETFSEDLPSTSRRLSD